MALLLAAGVYLGYIGLCIGMEPLARSRFRVLSKADVAAGASASLRERALNRMYRWEIYRGYLIILATAVFGGTSVGLSMALRNGMRGPRLLALALFLLALFTLPPLLSWMRIESQRTVYWGHGM